ncbi:FAD-dependent oxidoreductase [uncultured Xylophilus sp.]|uniref:NAD(P)/FAD-dependent oxidoreductase n=1 Tax=uncultured Xylophilus sp. TaxID=296832 RepID=UPI0025DD7E89|nr:FAD-dependent oxidoreductase [uncultured Xylophilus sp.]
MPLPPAPRPKAPRPASRIAIVGAGIAGIACARTLVQAGHDVTVFEADAAVGGRMATETSPYGGFDSGAQYFTVRDKRFALALEATGAGCRPWSATTVRVLDPQGRVAAAGLPPRKPHWVAVPGMAALPQLWAAPLAAAGRLYTGTAVTALERDTLDRRRWQLRTDGATPVHAGFDTVLLALPAPQAAALLQAADADPGAAALAQQVEPATMAPCWTLMLAFPQASQPGVVTLGPQWNAARSTHHRIAWLARESSKPGRERIERWTVQASEVWSEEHRHDTPDRVRDKMLRAFAEVTGIRATAGHAAVRLWLHAKTTQPAGRSHLWDASAGLGACGDWCIGHRVEDAFVSGLELALAVI